MYKDCKLDYNQKFEEILEAHKMEYKPQLFYFADPPQEHQPVVLHFSKHE